MAQTGFCAATALGLVLFAAPLALAAPFVPKRDPQCVAYSPTGKVAATACSGMSDDTFPPRPHPDVRKCGVIALWDVASGDRLWRAETFGDITKLAFSADGSLLAMSRLYVAADGVTLPEVRIFTAATGQVAKSLDRCQAFDFSPDGRQLAVRSRTRCVVYSLDDWSKETQVPPLGAAISLAFAPDASTLCGIIASEEGKFLIRACDLSTKKVAAESRALDEPFYSLAFAPDGSTLASGHSGGNVVVWNYPAVEVRARLQTGNKGLAHPIFSPDGRLLAAGCQENGDVVIWNARGLDELQRLTFEKGAFHTFYPRPDDDHVRPEKDPTRFAFSADSAAVFVGCYGGILRAVAGGGEIRRFGD